jgi:hypothetical protein
MLGDKTIADFDEGNDRATLAANLYPFVRDDMLRSHFWNCATKRVLLAPEVTAPAFDYAHQFALPGDFLRVRQVGQDYEEIEYTVESGKLLCDLNPLPLIYIWRNETPASWDTMLIHVMTLAMAAQMAYPITKSSLAEETRFKQLEMALRRARAVDGQDTPPEDFGTFDLVRARFRSRI